MFTCISIQLPAQTSIGMTGLLTIPSADMQQDKTVVLGVNFLNKELTPDVFNYHTYNYYLNVTILPFLEVGYSCTLFKGSELITPEKKGKFVNQDRALSARVRILKEGKYHPAIILGANDISKELILTYNETNQFYSNIYLVAGKHFSLGNEIIGTHLSYSYTKRKGSLIRGVMLGISYKSSFIPSLKLIAEGYRASINIGANYFIFNHLLIQCLLQNGQYLSGGIAYKIYL